LPKQPPEIIVFIDRCLGRYDVRHQLESAGVKVRLHDDHFGKDIDDETWIREVSESDWVILTKDKAIRRNPLEKQTLLECNAAAFILTAKGLDGEQQAQAFLAALPRIQRSVLTFSRPLLATVSASGKITILSGQRKGGVKKKTRTD